jgi:hypothetical protein
MEVPQDTNVGHVDEHGAVYCAACWKQQVADGEHGRRSSTPTMMASWTNFWIEDTCGGCNQQVQIRSVKVLA